MTTVQFTAGRSRMYAKEFPDVDECVMVNVRSIAEMGAYVTLLEYDDIEGMILLSELSRRRIRSVNRLIRVGKNEVAMVMRVDKEKGYIDLSKRRVAPEDIEKCEDRYNKSKTVHSVLRHVCEGVKMELKDVCERVAWPLYEKYGHAHEAFRAYIRDEEEGAKMLDGLDAPQELKDALLVNIKRRMAPQPIKIRADIEATCFKYDGIDAIRECLLAGQAMGTENAPIQIKLVAPPLYVCTTQAYDKDEGIEVLNTAVEKIKELLVARGGHFVVKSAARVTSKEAERELQELMDKLEGDAAEVDGDEPTED